MRINSVIVAFAICLFAQAVSSFGFRVSSHNGGEKVALQSEGRFEWESRTLTPQEAQSDEVKFDSAQPKITTVAAMRARKAPLVTAEEIMRLKLGFVISAIARSASQDTIGGKTDYWYRVNQWTNGSMDKSSEPFREIRKKN